MPASVRRVLLSLLPSVLLPAGLAAQAPLLDPHTAVPERPTVATHAWTMAPGWVELETGIELDRLPDHTEGALSPTSVKIGLVRRLQLEIVTPIVHPPDATTTGIGDVSLGLKWRFVEGGPIAGSFAVLPVLRLPSGSSESGTGTGTAQVDVGAVWSHKVHSVEIDLNYIYRRSGGDGTFVPRNATIWAVGLGGAGVGRVGWTAEISGNPATSGPAGVDSTAAFLVGPTLLVRNWLVFDAGVVVPVFGPQAKAFFAGGTYNIGRVWKRA